LFKLHKTIIAGWFKTLILLIFLSFTFNTQAFEPFSAKKLKKLGTNCQLVFGWDVVKPYQFLNAAGEAEGLQIDLINAILTELDCAVEFKHYVWDELVEGIKNGEVDFMADATITSERQKFSYFSDSYRQETFSMYVRRNQFEEYQFKAIEEMMDAGFRLGVTSGYVYSDEIERLRSQAKHHQNFIYSDSNLENYRLILENKIDGFMEDSLIAGYELRKSRRAKRIVALPAEVFRADVSFMFSKQSVSPELVETFNHVLARTKQTNAYKQAWLIGIVN
jgi:polar amino acid transport system substrate-binding protein